MSEMNTLGIKEFEKYAEAHTKPIHELLAELKEITIQESDYPQMMIGNLEGKFLQLLVALSGAKKVLEIGTFTGYSTFCLADAIGPHGQIITIDVNERTTDIARSFMHRAGYSDRVIFALGNALEILPEIEGPIDLAFIDADKMGYDSYYEALLPKIKPSGFLVFDNMLWGGEVLNPQTAEGHALHSLNTKLRQDPRVENLMLPLRDGIQIVQKL